MGSTLLPNLGWITYTPSNDNVTLGNGTETARYYRIGKLVCVSYRLTFGSTTSFTGTVNIGLPSTSVSYAAGVGISTDSGTSNFNLFPVVDPASAKAVLRSQSIGTHTGTQYPRWDNATNSTTPFTWTTNDVVSFSIVYEEA